MEKSKKNFNNILSYILSKRVLTCIIIVVILLIPIGVILTNKYLSNKAYNIEKIENRLLSRIELYYLNPFPLLKKVYNYFQKNEWDR